MRAVEGQALSGHELRVEPMQRRSLGVIGPDVQDLQREPLVDRGRPDPVDRELRLLASGSVESGTDVGIGHGRRQRNQHRPVPGILAPVGEARRVVTGPQPLEGTDDQVITRAGAEGELDGVSRRVEGTDGVRVRG